jgi:hypothetical protein
MMLCAFAGFWEKPLKTKNNGAIKPAQSTINGRLFIPLPPSNERQRAAADERGYVAAADNANSRDHACHCAIFFYCAKIFLIGSRISVG